jgi:hypothetical protein
LLGSDLETDNDTTFAASQQIFNKQEQTAGARERLDKHVPAAMDTHATTEEPLETALFYAVSAKGLYNEGIFARTITASVQLENKNSGRGSQGACRQDELIDGKPPVV